MKKILFIPIALLLLFMGSCKKWLDVKPDDQVYLEDVLKDREGFTQALSGIYGSLGSRTLYGKNLEYGLMDAMAGYWKIDNNNYYYGMYKFDYNNLKVKDTIASIWTNLYSNIHQCNLILDQIDNIEQDEYHNLIKGEVLGLRAFLHLEVFKLFGPVVKVKGLNTVSIPYYQTATKVPKAFETSNAYFDLIEADLQEAKKYLASDPIQTVGREANSNSGSALTYNSLLDRRGIHMNYYAVLALLARKSQWEGDLQTAALRAQELIDLLKKDNYIRFIESDEIENNIGNKDIRFTKENILGLYVNKLNDLTKVSFENKEIDAYAALEPDYDSFLSDIYQSGTGSSNDLRLNYWNINSKYFGKFNISKEFVDDSKIDTDHYFEVQLFNLPELYFILAEASLNSNLQKSIDEINAIRAHRKMPNIAYNANLTSETVKKYLIDEVRREYIGEGYLFTFYKRLFNPIYRSSGDIAPAENNFVFPIPTDELTYNTAN